MHGTRNFNKSLFEKVLKETYFLLESLINKLALLSFLNIKTKLESQLNQVLIFLFSPTTFFILRESYSQESLLFSSVDHSFNLEDLLSSWTGFAKTHVVFSLRFLITFSHYIFSLHFFIALD